MTAPSWWPPKVGDKLRGVWSSNPKHDPLLHVVAVFEHDGATQVVVAEWQSTRWRYDVRGESAAIVGMWRPNGTPRVQR